MTFTVLHVRESPCLCPPVTGVRRVNVIMTRGGAALQEHMKKVIRLSKLVDEYKNDLDEKGETDPNKINTV